MAAVVIVTVTCSAMLLSVGQAMQASSACLDSSRANLLAEELMTEISACRWADRDNPNHWGPGDGEYQSRTRVLFDDLDDYDGWSGAPQTKSGTKYDRLQSVLFPSVPSHPYATYLCAVHVEYVSADGEPVPAGQMSAYRRVTVEVSRPGQPTERLTQIFQDHAPLLGRSHWFDPNVQEPVASVTIVP